MNKYFVKKDVFEELEKAFGHKDIGKLTKKVVTDKNGKQRTVYVKNGEEPKKVKQHKTEGNTEPKGKETEQIENNDSKSEFNENDVVTLEGKVGNYKVVSKDPDGSYHVVSEDGKSGFKVSFKYMKKAEGSTHAEGDIVQFKDATGKNHNGKIIMVGKDFVTIVDNITKNSYDVKHDDIKVLAKVNDKDAIRNFYDASGMKPGWRDGSKGLQPASCDSLEGLLQAASEVQKEFGKLSDERQQLFKSDLGVDTLLLKRATLKNGERIKEKLREDEKANKDPELKGLCYDEESDTYHCRTIRDTDGHTFTCKSIDDLQKIFNYFKEQPDIIRMKNNFANPTDVGYSDINMNIRLSNGTIAEIQLNTTANIVAKERYGHSLYEVWRSVKSDPEYKELADAMGAAQKKLYGLSNKYSKDGNFPDISQDEVFSPEFKHEPYAEAIRDIVADAIPLYAKAKATGKINDKTAKHFDDLLKYIKK